MNRSCDVCGKSYVAKRPGSRFCGATCRKRNQRRPVTSIEVTSSTVGQLVLVTERELVAAGRLRTVMGQQALELARSIVSPLTTGSAKASLSKEFRAVMAAVLAAAPGRADELDELRMRRDAKRLGQPS
jgi:hypothetical protein